MIDNLLKDLNRIWHNRERNQLERLKNKYGTEVINLRRHLSTRASYDEVMANKRIARLKTDVKNAYKEVKQKGDPNVNYNKQGAQRVNSLTKNQDKRNEVKVMTNYNADEIRDTVLADNNNIDYNTKNNIVNSEINKTVKLNDIVTTDPISNKKRLNLLFAMTEINTGSYNATSDNTDADTAVSQGKIALDTVAGKVFYSIQIGCLSNMTSELNFRNKYNVTERMFLFTYGTQYKYCIGVFKKYKDAAKHLKKVLAETKLPGAYIVSFINGKLVSITVAKSKSGESRIPFAPALSMNK